MPWVEVHDMEGGATSGQQNAPIDGPRRGPGKPPGYPKPPGSGRQKGQPNKRTVSGKELIAQRGKPLEVLADVCAGRRLRVASPTNPSKSEFVYPSAGDRIRAAMALAAKLLPDVKATEISGPNGQPVATVSAVARFDPLAVALDFAKQLGRPLKPGIEQALIEARTQEADNDDG